jgi:acyl-CoA synthetase (AMP-forming)/AMP-acid ligase II
MSLDGQLGSLHEPLTGNSLDSAACRRRIASRARLFQRLGLQPRDRVLLHHGNTADFLIDVLAVWMARGCVVPVDPRLTAFEVASLARTARPRLSLHDRQPDSQVASTLAGLEIQVVYPDDGDLDARDAPVQAFGAADDDAIILFTSGTTGDPKGVVHTHRSLQMRWQIQRAALGTPVLDRTLFLLPTSFAWGLLGNALYAWLSGADLYVLPAFRSDVMLQLGTMCDEFEITYLPSVPALWRIVLRTVAPPKKGTLRRIACGTSPLPARLWRDIRAWSAVDDVLNVYSMSECGMLATHSSAYGEPEDGLVGTPFAGVEIRVVPAGESHELMLASTECLRDTAGAIWAQTPTLMRGYLGRDDLTSEVVWNGWFRTGDIGCLDDRGLLYLRGRDKDMINVGGVKVYPLDIDLALGRSDVVLDICTFGMADPLQGEQIAVAVVLKQPHDQSLGRLHQWATSQLAPFQMPRRWFLVNDIPRTARGKLNRTAVATHCAGSLGIDLRTLAAKANPDHLPEAAK